MPTVRGGKGGYVTENKELPLFARDVPNSVTWIVIATELLWITYQFISA